jgi:hypothetical protein
VRKAMVMMGAAGVALALMAPAAAGSVTAGAARAKTVSVDKYAKSLCTTYTTWQNSITDSTPPTADITDPAAGQKAFADYFNGLIASTKSATAKLKKAGIPDVEHGKQVAKSFQTFLTKASTEISGALDQINTADPTSPQFVATVTQVTTNLATLDTRLGDPFSKVASQDLLGAFKDQKACKGVVTIIGG